MKSKFHWKRRNLKIYWNLINALPSAKYRTKRPGHRQTFCCCIMCMLFSLLGNLKLLHRRAQSICTAHEHKKWSVLCYRFSLNKMNNIKNICKAIGVEKKNHNSSSKRMMPEIFAFFFFFSWTNSKILHNWRGFLSLFQGQTYRLKKEQGKKSA